MMNEKNCIVCGKPFIPGRKSQICCSKECGKEQNKRRVMKNWYRNHNKEPHDNYCKICGKKIEQAGNRQLHEECVIQDILNTMKAGKKLSPIQAGRIAKRKVSTLDLRKRAAEENSRLR